MTHGELIPRDGFAMLKEMPDLSLRRLPLFSLLAAGILLPFGMLQQTSASTQKRRVPSAATAHKTVTLTPEYVESGSPELIRVEAPNASSVEGEWLGHPVLFFPAADHRAWFA